MTQPLPRLITMMMALTLVGVLGAPALVNAQDKEARGSVTALSDSSLTISSGDRSMTFVVDRSTKLEVKAAARQTRQAGTGNTQGVKMTQYLKSGDPVLVHYKDADGRMTALSVRPVST